MNWFIGELGLFLGLNVVLVWIDIVLVFGFKFFVVIWLIVVVGFFWEVDGREGKEVFIVWFDVIDDFFFKMFGFGFLGFGLVGLGFLGEMDWECEKEECELCERVSEEWDDDCGIGERMGKGCVGICGVGGWFGDCLIVVNFGFGGESGFFFGVWFIFFILFINEDIVEFGCFCGEWVERGE